MTGRALVLQETGASFHFINMSLLGTHVCCTLSLSIFTTRCHASAVYAVVVCLAMSVSLVSSQYLSKQLDESSWFLAWRLPSTHTTVLQENLVIFRIRVLPSGTSSCTPALESIATASRSRCQQNSSSSLTVKLVDDTYTTIGDWCLFTTSRSTITL